MIKDVEWMRTAYQLARYLETTVTLTGAQDKEEVIELFQNVHLLFPQWMIMTCPIMHPDIHYISENCPLVLGYSTAYFANNNYMERFSALIHDADKADVRACYTFLHEYLQEVPPEEHHKYRPVLYYRFKSPAGTYLHLHDERASLALPGGNFYYGIYQNITEVKPFTGVRLEIFLQEQHLKRIKEFKPSNERAPLSKREHELVLLMRQGLSTKEMGAYLQISPNTVRNIKSKLFEKYSVNNSIELLNRV